MDNSKKQETFDKLMKRPSIDEASKRYNQMQQELQTAMGKVVPTLAKWQSKEGGTRSSCDSNSYPGVNLDGQTESLPNYFSGPVPEQKYDEVLQTIGSIASKYGFEANPQRLYDGPKGHDAAFHNVNDDGKIDFHVDPEFSSLGVTVGCYLTAEAKKRGHPSES